MQTDLSNALLLLIIGMVSVFFILTIIVISAKLLIYAVNRMSEKERQKYSAHQISPAVLAAATAVVEEITQGKGQITGIKKL